MLTQLKIIGVQEIHAFAGRREVGCNVVEDHITRIELQRVETGITRVLRVVRVTLIGKNGETDTLRGEDFRLCLDPTGRKIKSAIFTVEKKGSKVTFQNGLGFGHGVGLCQCGTQGMARKGKNYKTILSYYFPESKLVTIYPKEMPTKP